MEAAYVFRPQDSRNDEQSEQIVNIHGHFINFSGVVLLDVPEYAHIVISDEVYGDASAIEAPGSTDSVDVELARLG